MVQCLRVHAALLEDLSQKIWVKGQFIDNIHHLQLQFQGIKCPWTLQLFSHTYRYAYKYFKDNNTKRTEISINY